MPIGSSSSFAHGSNVFDLDRLEVLSGPQGTLLNTYGFIDDPSRSLDRIDASKTRSGHLSLRGEITSDLSLRITGMNQAIARDGSTVVDKSIVTHAPLFGRYNHESRFAEPFDQDLQVYSTLLNWNLGWGTVTLTSSWQHLGIPEQQFRSGAADIAASGQNHGCLELFSQDIQHVLHA
jgi:hypothetical protein